MVFVCWAAPLGWIVMHSDHSVVPLTWGVILPGQILCALLTFGAAVEYRAMLSSLFPRNGFWLGYLWLIFEFYLDLLNVSLPRNLDNYILLVVVALEAFIWGKRSQRTRWSRASLFFSGNVFLLIAGGSLLSFYDSPFQDAFIRYSSPWFRQTGIFVMLASIVACDTMAYFIGSLFGRHHFTSISPNKTVEGTAAGTQPLVSKPGRETLSPAAPTSAEERISHPRERPR